MTHFLTCRKILLSSARRPPLAKTGKEATFSTGIGNEVECRIYGGWVKLRSYFSVFGSQFVQFLEFM